MYRSLYLIVFWTVHFLNMSIATMTASISRITVTAIIVVLLQLICCIEDVTKRKIKNQKPNIYIYQWYTQIFWIEKFARWKLLWKQRENVLVYLGFLYLRLFDVRVVRQGHNYYHSSSLIFTYNNNNIIGGSLIQRKKGVGWISSIRNNCYGCLSKYVASAINTKITLSLGFAQGFFIPCTEQEIPTSLPCSLEELSHLISLKWTALHSSQRRLIGLVE